MSTINYVFSYDDEANQPGQLGSAHSVSSELPEQNKVDEMYKIAEEVSGKKIDREKRIGFI